MSGDKYKSFFEEMQNKFYWKINQYIPLCYPCPGLEIELSPKRKHETCPECGCMRTYVHERKERRIHGGTFTGVPVMYKMERIRHICRECGVTFVDEYECLPWYCGMTTETEAYIVWSLGSMTMTDIAEEIGVSVQTISNRAAAFGRQERETMLSGCYRYLSMDEIFMGRDKNGKHNIYWVLNDISTPWKSNNILIDKGRTKAEVIKRLGQLAHPESVMAVCIDMWKPYLEAVEDVFPQAEIVIDRFHVMKLASESINTARINADVSPEMKAAMKKDASLFLASIYKLSDDDLVKLDNYLKADPLLEATYFFVQELMEFYNIRGYDRALEYLCKWETEVIKSGINLPIYKTICEWLPYIMNFFHFRITSGKTEGRNNLIRQIDRMGFHYGLDGLQACIYAHDRKQEYIKWQKYMRNKNLHSFEADSYCSDFLSSKSSEKTAA